MGGLEKHSIIEQLKEWDLESKLDRLYKQMDSSYMVCSASGSVQYVKADGPVRVGDRVDSNFRVMETSDQGGYILCQKL